MDNHRTMVPTHTFWLVTESNKIYSAFTRVYVAETDPVFCAWIESGETPTKVPTEEKLFSILNAFV